MIKFYRAIQVLRPNTEYIYGGVSDVETEENFNNVRWVTDSNENNEAITTTTCPHSEITWTLVKAEMDKL